MQTRRPNTRRIVQISALLLPASLLLAINTAHASGDVPDGGAASVDSSGMLQLPESVTRALSKRDYLAPAVQSIGINVFVYWLPSRFILRNDFSYISWSTIGHNLKSPFVIDNDGFAVNQLGHPYQGSNYFNAARSMGFGYWSSLPYVFVGSLQWEYFMEAEPPSRNDVVTTTIGGQALGEMLYRLSDLILDDSSTGRERTWRETAAFVVNPVRGLNRALTGRMSARGDTPTRPPVTVRLSETIGPFWHHGSATTPELVTTLYLEHGNIRRLPDVIRPFDYFEFEFGRSVTSEGQGWVVFVNSIVAGLRVGESRRRTYAVAIVQNYDFFSSGTNDVGSAGIGAGLFVSREFGENVRLDWYLSAMGIYGAISRGEMSTGTNYDLGPGASVRSRTRLTHRTWGRLEALDYEYWVRTSGEESEGHNFARFHQLGYAYPVWRGLALNTNVRWVDKVDYTNLSDRYRHELSYRVGVEWEW